MGKHEASWLQTDGAGMIQRDESIFHLAQYDEIDANSWDPAFKILALNTLAICAFSKLFH